MTSHRAAIIVAVLFGASLFFPATSAQAERGSASAGKNKAATCAACHGADGNGGADPNWPKLAGNSAEYIAKQLADFKTGTRKDPIMQGMAAALSPQDMRDLGAYYESLAIKPGSARHKETLKMGERLYRGGNAKTGVSACMSCHGPSGHGIPPRFPRVSGQSAAYAEKQLLAFKSNKRSNDGEAMTRTAFRMSEEEIKAVADYMAGLH
jgi:cytochrome c553